jgi:hypothetical protein
MASTYIMINEQHVENVMEGSDRHLILCTVPECSWSDRGKLQKTAARIVGLRGNISS